MENLIYYVKDSDNEITARFEHEQDRNSFMDTLEDRFPDTKFTEGKD